MILSVSEQARLFLLACAAGFVIGFVYDIFRIVRITFPHPSFLIQIEDILYWALASVGMFIFLQYATAGEVRAYSIFGAALGALVYFLTLSVVIMTISSAIINFVKRLLVAIFTILLVPLRFAVQILMLPYGWLRALLRPIKKTLGKLLQNSLAYVKIRKQRLARDVSIILRKR